MPEVGFTLTWVVWYRYGPKCAFFGTTHTNTTVNCEKCVMSLLEIKRMQRAEMISSASLLRYMDALGKAQTALVLRNARIGTAQAERDAGIRVSRSSYLPPPLLLSSSSFPLFFLLLLFFLFLLHSDSFRKSRRSARRWISSTRWTPTLPTTTKTTSYTWPRTRAKSTQR